MNVFKSFIKIQLDKKILLIKTFFLMILIKLALHFFSLKRIKKISLLLKSTKKRTNTEMKDILWAINVISNLFKFKCLTTALAGQILLSRCNYQSKLKIGVKNIYEFEAHAWLEIDNEIILGEHSEAFISILEID